MRAGLVSAMLKALVVAALVLRVGLFVADFRVPTRAIDLRTHDITSPSAGLYTVPIDVPHAWWWRASGDSNEAPATSTLVLYEGSHLFCGLFHPDPIDTSDDPLAEGAITRERDPYAANQAIPCLLCGRNRARMESLFPRLRVIARQRLALFTYPLSGGFRPWTLVPARLVPVALRIEDWLLPVLGPLMAFRMLGVIEKR